jgi:hypothetical protein
MEEVYDALIDSLSLREQRTTHEWFTQMILSIKLD